MRRLQTIHPLIRRGILSFVSQMTRRFFLSYLRDTFLSFLITQNALEKWEMIMQRVRRDLCGSIIISKTSIIRKAPLNVHLVLVWMFLPGSPARKWLIVPFQYIGVSFPLLSYSYCRVCTFFKLFFTFYRFRCAYDCASTAHVTLKYCSKWK